MNYSRVDHLTITQTFIDALNAKYLKLSPINRVKELYKDFNSKNVMLTSSFAATSALLLKLFSDTNKEQIIYFIDTGYHFPETLIYKQYLTQLYDLKVEDIKAEDSEHEKTTKNKTWETDPNLCCSINKVRPLEALKEKHKVWVSGLMSWQSNHRNSLTIFETKNGILKFYPLLDVSQEKRDQFITDHHLPFHPLVSKGYLSIGCSNCTVPGNGRDGRWNNSPKTECGLHL